MQGAKATLESLLSSGEGFNYQNFSNKSEYGHTSSFKPAWITWTTRVAGAIEKTFGAGSAPVRLIRSAEGVRLINYGNDSFERAKSYYIGALQAAIDIVEEDTYGEIMKEREEAEAPKALSNKVFVVHGHDEKAKQELEIVLREMGLEPIVLHRQVDGGRTLIEKFEHYADVGYAFILMTPDEMSYLIGDDNKADKDRNKEVRARPNVIFEFGFFVGSLGRSRTCCLHRGDINPPSDLNGLIYKRFERSVSEVAWDIAKELKAIGYKLL